MSGGHEYRHHGHPLDFDLALHADGATYCKKGSIQMADFY